MITLNEDRLKAFLLNRKSKLGTAKLSGIGEIISGVSLIISFLCSDFKDMLNIKAIYIEIASWLIAVLVLGFGLFLFIKSLFNAYTIDDLYKELVELDANNAHVYNIILLKNNQAEGKYLLFYSQRWRCKLFLNYQAKNVYQYNVNNEIQNMRLMFTTDTGINCDVSNISYLGKIDSTKYSYGDKVEKNYIFHFYSINIVVPANMQNTNFACNGNKYYWMTLNEMYNCKNIVKKNKDVLDYIRHHNSTS